MTSASGVRAAIIAEVSSTNNSEPESLDSLVYDDWEGQFEFVGSNSNSNSTSTSSTSNGTNDNKPSTDCDVVEDLNLTVPKSSSSSSAAAASHYLATSAVAGGTARNCVPILIDEETFLSMQPNDIDEPYSMLGDDQSNQLIENALKHLQFDHHSHRHINNNNNTTTLVPLQQKQPQLPPNKRTSSSQFDVNSSSSLSHNNIIELKNRRNMHNSDSNNNSNHHHNSIHNNNHSNNNNHNNHNQNNNNSCCHSDGFKMSDVNFAHELYDSLLKEQVSDDDTPYTSVSPPHTLTPIECVAIFHSLSIYLSFFLSLLLPFSSSLPLSINKLGFWREYNQTHERTLKEL